MLANAVCKNPHKVLQNTEKIPTKRLFIKYYFSASYKVQKYKAYISKYMAYNLKYMACILKQMPYLFFGIEKR